MSYLFLLGRIVTFTGATVFGFASVMQAYMGGSTLAVVFLVLSAGQFAFLAIAREPGLGHVKSQDIARENRIRTTGSDDYLDIEHADFSVPRKKADWSQFS